MILTNEPSVRNTALLKQIAETADSPNEGIVRTVRPLCHDVEQFHVVVTDCLYIDRMYSLSVDERLIVHGRSLDGNVCTIYCPDYIGKSSNGMEIQLVFDDRRLVRRKFDEVWRQLHEGLRYSVY